MGNRSEECKVNEDNLIIFLSFNFGFYFKHNLDFTFH